MRGIAHRAYFSRSCSRTAGCRVAAESFRAACRARRGQRGLPNAIRIHGAREHNLKNISLDIPRDKMVVITGLSGSGKSTLAFDILFAEGQRRFLDSMSPYARQFVEQLEKPDVDFIDGLPPSVAIEQRVTRGGGKSTVATVTEVYHFLRLLFAKTRHAVLSRLRCAGRKADASPRSRQRVQQLAEARRRPGARAAGQGAQRLSHRGRALGGAAGHSRRCSSMANLTPVASFRKLERFREHTIDVVVGEIAATRSDARNLVQRALEIGKGTAHVLDAKRPFHVVSTEMSCPDCGRAFEELDPRLFSFNSPHGWCEECRGFGEVWPDNSSTRNSIRRSKNELAEERSTNGSTKAKRARVRPATARA